MIHECDVCGDTGPWTKGWQSWGSIRDLEYWGLIIKTCSDSCREVLRCPQALMDRKAAQMGLVRHGGKYRYPHTKQERKLLAEAVA